MITSLVAHEHSRQRNRDASKAGAFAECLHAARFMVNELLRVGKCDAILTFEAQIKAESTCRLQQNVHSGRCLIGD
jgi:hypothetical protein